MDRFLHALPKAAQAIVDKLGLKHTYEGPYLKRSYQSDEQRNGRPDGSSVYGIAAKDMPSLLHRLDCDELWHFYAGNVLLIYLFNKDGLVVERLGNDVLNGEKPLVVVPKGTIFGAAVQGENDWCFFGCTCVPGFEISRCEFIRSESKELESFGQHKKIIEKLTAFKD